MTFDRRGGLVSQRMNAAPTDSAPMERELLEAARGGDEDAYRRLVEPHRAELHAHCYRMLGSVHDAEDALQETLLRAWRGVDGLREAESRRAWLYAIATNVCRTELARRAKRGLPHDFGPSVDGQTPPGQPITE